MKPSINVVEWLDLPTLFDDRGALTAIEEFTTVPIEIKRIFYMHQVNADRGGHAHIDTDQVIIPIYGSFSVKIFDGVDEIVFDLVSATKGLFVPRLLFTDLYDFSKGAVCLVLANTQYNMSKSIRDINSYKGYINNL